MCFELGAREKWKSGVGAPLSAELRASSVFSRRFSFAKFRAFKAPSCPTKLRSFWDFTWQRLDTIGFRRSIVLLTPFRTKGARRSGTEKRADESATHSRSAEERQVPAAAVRSELNRVLGSSNFRYSERLSRFLKFAVEQQLAGNAEQIKESVLAMEIFDRDSAYDSRVDSIVRVEASRLRSKLNAYYTAEGRYSPVIIELPKGGYVPTFRFRPQPAPAIEHGQETARLLRGRQVPVRTLVIAGFACLLVTVALTLWLRPRASGPPPPLRRLTSDVGLTFQPAISRDGKLLAYSSDRGGAGDLDIWVQQVSGGTPLRLTDNPADDVDPTFSPDGETIAYRAEGAVDGIFLVPALGGQRTFLARGGYRPRFSPDGTHIAYWTGERMFRAAKIFIVSASGGNPVPFIPDFPYAAYPIWSPDGRYIAFVGTRSQLVREESNTDDWDWWIAPVAGGTATRLSASQVFTRQGLLPPETGASHHRIVPDCWSDSGYLLFSARRGDQTNIWRLRVSSRTLQISGSAEQLSFGAGREDHPSVAADGMIVFSVLAHKTDVWALPIDSDTAQPRGPIARLTSGEGNYTRPTVAPHGDRLAFLSDRSGNEDVWVKDLKTGAEKALTATAQDEVSPLPSPDGSDVAFGYPPPLPESIWLVPFSGGSMRQICADCGEPRTWLPDGRGLLYQKLSQGESLIGLLDRSGYTVPLLQSSESALFSPSVSRDGKWLALIVRTPPSDDRVMVVRLHHEAAAAKPDWISVTEHGSWVNKPRWSPNGNLLYYISDRDGFTCIWANRLDPITKEAVGAPKAVMHFHTGRSSLDSAYGLELSVADDKLVVDIGESSGNIWLAPAARR
jgi:Tol biopolymer transport system component